MSTNAVLVKKMTEDIRYPLSSFFYRLLTYSFLLSKLSLRTRSIDGGLFLRLFAFDVLAGGKGGGSTVCDGCGDLTDLLGAAVARHKDAGR